MNLKFIKQSLESKVSLSFLAFLFCLTLFCIRAGARIKYAEFWAEDGNVFLNEILQYSWRSIFISHAGYFHFLQRGILFFLYSLLPLKLLATGVAFFSIGTVAFITSRWTSEDYQWLLESPFYRWGLCFALCLAPGLGEMLGNLCNLNWFFTLWVALLLLKDPRQKIKTWEWALTALIFFSIGTGLLLLPLTVWRFRKKPTNLLWVAVFFIVYTLLLMTIRDPSRTADPTAQLLSDRGQTSEWIRLYLRQFRNSVFLQPVLGDALTTKLSLGKGVQWGGFLSSLFLCFIVSWYINKRGQPSVHTLLLFLCSFSSWVFLVWMGRAQSIKVFQQPLGPWFFENRYSFPMCWPAFLFWFMLFESCFAKPIKGPLKNGFLLLFLASTFLTNFYRFLLPPHSKEGAWKQKVPTLQSSIKTGEPKTVKVKVFPGEQFNFDYRAEPHSAALSSQ